MKKIYYLIFVLLLVFSFASCEQTKKVSDSTDITSSDSSTSTKTSSIEESTTSNTAESTTTSSNESSKTIISLELIDINSSLSCDAFDMTRNENNLYTSVRVVLKENYEFAENLTVKYLGQTMDYISKNGNAVEFKIVEKINFDLDTSKYLVLDESSHSSLYQVVVKNDSSYTNIEFTITLTTGYNILNNLEVTYNKYSNGVKSSNGDDKPVDNVNINGNVITCLISDPNWTKTY